MTDGVRTTPCVLSGGASFWAALRTVGLPATPGFGSLLEATRG